MRKFVDLELSDEQKLDGTIGTGPTRATPDYPYGLRISLSEDELTKLGLTEDPEVGDLLHFSAMAEVTSYSKGDGEMGPHRRVELQIKMMCCMENESTEMGDDD